LTLYNATGARPLVFDYVPIPMILAIIKPFVASEKHDGGIIAERN